MTAPMLSAPQPLTDRHQLADFDSGEPTLDDWLKRRAAKNQANGSSRTYVVCEGDTVIGYYCLAAGAIGHAEAPSSMKRNRPDPIPVLREARRYADSMRRAGRSQAEVAEFLRTMESRAGLVLAVAPEPPAAKEMPVPEANPGAVLDLLPVLVAELARQGFARIVRSRISPRGAEEQVAIPIGRVRAALEIQGLEPRPILAAWRDAGLLRTTDKGFTCNARINGVSVPCLMLWRAVAQ